MRHLVELLAQRGELVVADRRHLGGEVAACEPAGGGEEPGDLLLQRARHEHGADDRDQEEAQQDGAGREPLVRRRVGDRRRDREREDADALPFEGLDVGEVLHEVCGVADVQRRALAGRQPVGIQARQRRGQDPVAVEHDDAQAGEGLDAPDVRRCVDERDAEAAELVTGLRDQALDVGRDRGLVAHAHERPAVLGEHDALEAVAVDQLLGAPAGTVDIAGLQGSGEDGVAAHRPDLACRELLLLAKEGPREHVLLGDPGLGLTGLAVVDEPEQQERHRQHRDDDDDDEEQRQAVAKTHCCGAYRRARGFPAPLDASGRGYTVGCSGL